MYSCVMLHCLAFIPLRSKDEVDEVGDFHKTQNTKARKNILD